MSLHPARDEAEARKKRDLIALCGRNRGPHDYIPIEYMYVEEKETKYKRTTRFLCRVCFFNVRTSTLLQMYKDSNVDAAQNHDTAL